MLEAGRQCPFAVLLARERRERDGGRAAALVVAERAQAPDQRVAVLAWHADVAEQYVGRLIAYRSERLVGGRRERDLGAALTKHVLDQFARVGIVVDDEHAQPGER